MFMTRWTTLLAGSFAIAAVAAACGPSQPAGNVPQPSDEPTAVPTAPATGAPTAPTATPTAVPNVTPSVTPSAEPPKGPPSVGISTSALLADVTKLGIDLKKVGPLEKMKAADKKKLMPLFQKALGYKDCTGCHAPGKDKDHPIDVKIETHNMKMARGMFNSFVVKLRDEKGEAMFCDTCHTGPSGGTNHILERADHEALQKFMKENYEGKLSRADKAEHSCGTCHGEPFEPKVFAKVWNIKD